MSVPLGGYGSEDGELDREPCIIPLRWLAASVAWWPKHMCLTSDKRYNLGVEIRLGSYVPGNADRIQG